MTLDLETSTWQQLMDTGLARWDQKNDYREFANSLENRKEHIALLLGHFNYQTENGGVTQWVDNAYGLCINEVICALESIDTELTKDLAEKLRCLSEFVNTNLRDRGCFGKYWIGDDDSDDDYDTYEGRVLAEEITNWYYANSDQIHQDIENHLNK